MRIQSGMEFEKGYNSITELNGKHSEMLMDFGILRLAKGDEFSDSAELEKLYVLLSGSFSLECDGVTYEPKRADCFNDDFWLLDVPKSKSVKIIGVSEDTEIAVFRTENEKDFPVKVHDRTNSTFEIRGQDTMAGAGERYVKTLLDYKLSPESNIMLGEDVHLPGRWAGFPSHSHNQPEIYFYKFFPRNGFGLVRLGDEGVLLEENDTLLINPDLVHPQVGAPGYAMYFLWAIRHLEGNPYLAPDMEEQHLWVQEPGAKYWPDIQPESKI